MIIWREKIKEYLNHKEMKKQKTERERERERGRERLAGQNGYIHTRRQRSKQDKKGRHTINFDNSQQCNSAC